MEGTKKMVIQTTEMHTAGDPVRIVESGFPKLSGANLIERMVDARLRHDYARKVVIFEPRGHLDMFGVLLQEPDPDNDADMAAIFLHAGGFASMCGHASLSLARYLVDHNKVKMITEPETEVTIQAPCGMLKLYVAVNNGKTGGSRLVTVPSYAFALDEVVNVAGIGPIKVDIGFGGNFFAIVADEVLGVDIHSASIAELTIIGSAVTDAVKRQVKITHPESKELAFIFGTVITDGKHSYAPGTSTMQLTETFERQVCRAPCGAGTTARVAVEYARGLIKTGEQRTFISRATGGQMTAKVLTETKFGPHDAVRVELCGNGYYTGKCTFTIDEEDPLKHGFLLD